MINVQLPPHPDMPGIVRRVLVPRVDGINYEEKTAGVVIRIEHYNADGSPNAYLGVKTDFMVSSNDKLVDQDGKLVQAGTPGAMGEFDWLAMASQSVPLPQLVLGMIQRNIERGNFTTGNYRN